MHTSAVPERQTRCCITKMRVCLLLLMWALLSPAASASLSPAVSMGIPPPPALPSTTIVYGLVSFRRMSSLSAQHQSIYADFLIQLAWVDSSVDTSQPFSRTRNFFPSITIPNLLRDDSYNAADWTVLYGYPPFESPPPDAPGRDAKWISATTSVAGVFSNRMKVYDFPMDMCVLLQIRSPRCFASWQLFCLVHKALLRPRLSIVSIATSLPPHSCCKLLVDSLPLCSQRVGVQLEMDYWSMADARFELWPNARDFVRDDGFLVSEWRVKGAGVVVGAHFYRQFNRTASSLTATVTLERQYEYYMTVRHHDLAAPRIHTFRRAFALVIHGSFHAFMRPCLPIPLAARRVQHHPVGAADPDGRFDAAHDPRPIHGGRVHLHGHH